MTAKQTSLKYLRGLLLLMLLCLVPMWAYAEVFTPASDETVAVEESTATEVAPSEPTATPAVTDAAVQISIQDTLTEQDLPAAEDIIIDDNAPVAVIPANETAENENFRVENDPEAGAITETDVEAIQDSASLQANSPDIAEPEINADSEAKPSSSEELALIDENPPELIAAEPDTAAESQGNRRPRAALALDGENAGNDDPRLTTATGDDAGVTNLTAGSGAKSAAEPADAATAGRGQLEDVPSTLTASGSDVIVEAYGLGVTREQALQAALMEAIAKVNGTSLSNTQVEELRYQLDAILEASGDKNKTGGVSGNESLQYGIANRVDFITNGLVKSYEIIAEGRVKKEYEISLRAVVAKYTPGIETQRQRIAVMPFRILNADGWQALYAELFTQRLVDYLAQTNRFAVVDRKFMAEKQAEFALLNSAQTPVAERVRIGNTLGADYMVVGQINKMEYWLTEEKLPYLNSMQYTLTARTSFNLQIIVPATGLITTAKTYDEKVELKFDGRQGLKLEDIEQAEIDKLAAASARLVGRDILNEVYPMMAITYSPEGVFTINQGGDTVKTGQKYNLRVYGEMLIDPYTKEELGRSEKTIGTVEITEVMPKFAFAKVVELSTMADLEALVAENKVLLRPAEDQAPAKTAPPAPKNQPKW